MINECINTGKYGVLNGVALAHGISHEEITILTWNFSPIIVTVLTVLVFIYFQGKKSSPLPLNGRDIFFLLGMFFLILALFSPIDPLSDKLGSVHMVQHTLLMMVSSPLIVLARPDRNGFIALGPLIKQNKFFSYISRLYQFRRPFLIWGLYAVTLWIWHLPFLYEKALHHPFIHDLQHLSFFLTSYLFWRVVLDPRGKRGLPVGVGILYVFVASLHAMILGVLMALSPVAWYASYENSVLEYGLTPLEDQQIAGFIMWMPACFTYFIIGIKQTFKLLQKS